MFRKASEIYNELCSETVEHCTDLLFTFVCVLQSSNLLVRCMVVTNAFERQLNRTFMKTMTT